MVKIEKQIDRLLQELYSIEVNSVNIKKTNKRKIERLLEWRKEVVLDTKEKCRELLFREGFTSRLCTEAIDKAAEEILKGDGL